jgi:hypothetical protein
VISICGETENEAYSYSPDTSDELKHNMYEAITSVEVSELKLVSKNLQEA